MNDDRFARDGELKLPARQELFAALVEAQDAGAGVPVSRELVAKRFGVSMAMVKAVEREGIAEAWPPLGP
jgi:hypothetical protein